MQHRQAATMSSTVWRSPEVEEKFHRLSSELADTQWDEIHYPRPSRDSDDADHTLSLRHELKLANHLAFLAQNTGGACTVSAVCLEETEDGLVARLASNENPRQKTVDGLQAIMDSLSRYSRQGTWTGREPGCWMVGWLSFSLSSWPGRNLSLTRKNGVSLDRHITRGLSQRRVQAGCGNVREANPPARAPWAATRGA